MDSTKLKAINEAQADRALGSTRHQEVLAHTDKVSDSVLSATGSLIEYLEGHTSKTEVVNQLESIKTPDVEFVVKALNLLDETIKSRPVTDLGELTGVMRELLSETEKIPKDHPEAVIPDKPIDYSSQLSSLAEAIKAVEKVVKAQKLIAEAPVVNVPAPNVNVDAPDLKPLQTGFKDVVRAVQAIVIPEFKTDNKAVEKLLRDANKLLQKLLEKPVSSGGGGGGSSWTAVGTNDLPTPLRVNDNGDLSVAQGIYTERFASDSGFDYVGEAPVGSSESSAVWTISRYDATSGKVALNVKWDDKLVATYV